jgi:exodeoxyribonuclease VII large subunit
VIKAVLETELHEVLVTGEISNFKQHTSGHRYFTLKDADAQISCVMWKSRTMNFTPADGMRVVVGGRVTVYPARGNYQLDCVFMRPDGVGELYRAYEKLKAELEERGWFDETRKRPLPRFPQRVGIATSRTGAALHDMLTTIDRRYRPLEIILRPTLVQGDGSAEDIAAAIRDLQGAGVDVIIAGRGGGSIEDLWAFNTEVVARAIVESTTPVISAVGHETDFTIADFVADRRAPTPTAAAVMVTPFTTEELIQHIDEMEQEFTSLMLDRTTELKNLVDEFVLGTALYRIEERLALMAQRIEQQVVRQQGSMLRSLELKQQAADHALQHIQALHPHRPLKLGYAVIERDQSPLLVGAPLRIGDNVRVVRWEEAAEMMVTMVTKLERGGNNGEEN